MKGPEETVTDETERATRHEPTPELAGEPLADPAPEPAQRDGIADPAMQVRAADLEPYVGLRYVAKLFRVIALILLMLLVAEVAVISYQDGWRALPELLAEGSRLLVLAGMLWGAGDLAMLLIDIGHDVRATRILIGRQSAQHPGEQRLPPPGDGVA
ncbi:MAG: hypothetical protein M3373_12885 [Gemmatimonadota bacterium]|nr:hypothetical protein [Gemmatimonadota bacterium]